MAYQKPIPADFTAFALANELNSREKFVAGMTRNGRSRRQAKSHLLLNGDRLAEFKGQFVAIIIKTIAIFSGHHHCHVVAH